jgi:hypothetical protein
VVLIVNRPGERPNSPSSGGYRRDVHRPRKRGAIVDDQTHQSEAEDRYSTRVDEPVWEDPGEELPEGDDASSEN